MNDAEELVKRLREHALYGCWQNHDLAKQTIEGLAANLIERQAEEIAVLRKDAERYRWMRSQHGIVRPDAACVFNIGHDWANVADGNALDNAIDAAMKEKP